MDQSNVRDRCFLHTWQGFAWTWPGLGNVVLHEGCKMILVHDVSKTILTVRHHFWCHVHVSFPGILLGQITVRTFCPNPHNFNRTLLNFFGHHHSSWWGGWGNVFIVIIIFIVIVLQIRLINSFLLCCSLLCCVESQVSLLKQWHNFTEFSKTVSADCQQKWYFFGQNKTILQNYSILSR